MKKTLLTLALVAMATVSSFAQGTINPLNGAFTRIKVDAGNGAALRDATTADGLQFSVFFGTSADAMTKLDGVMTIGATTGVLVGLPTITAIPGVGGANTVISLRITAENAQGWRGDTGIKQVTLASPSGPGTPLWSSTASASKFLPMIVTVPEPSSIALGVLGLGSLLLFRRRK